MELYFSPLACSMATRIALYEAGGDAKFVEVDTKTQRVLQDNSNFRDINVLGLVPVLRTTEGDLLTENAAILQYVAERFPDTIAPQNERERSRLQQWLCFIGTELHKGLFTPLLDRAAPSQTKAYTAERYASRLDYLDAHLAGREFLLDRFSVADGYLTTVLNWTIAVPEVDLRKWPNVNTYFERMKARPSIARAMAEEFEFYKEFQARHKAA